MPQLAQSTIDAFRGADESTQRQALSGMSMEAKRALLTQLKGADSVTAESGVPQKAPQTYAEASGGPGGVMPGIAQSLAKTPMAAIQWAQDIPNQVSGLFGGQPVSKVSPTPTWMEANGPEQKLGQNIGAVGQYAGAAALTGGASLPTQVASGGLTSGLIAAGAGQDPSTAATIGMAAPVTSAVLGKAVGSIRQYLNDKQYASAIYNKVARVATGERGIQAGAGATFKTDPGRTMADRGVSAWSSPQLKVESERTLGEIGNELSAKLQTSTVPMDVKKVINTDLPQVQAALKEVGIDPMPVTPNELGGLSMAKAKPMQELLLTPEQAHRFRSALGQYIDWNPAASINVKVANNPNLPLEMANEELKNSYFAINKMIDATVDGVKPINKSWQEAYLYTRALTDRIERLHGTQFGMPGSTVTGMANRYMFSAPGTKFVQLMKKAQAVVAGTPPAASAIGQGVLQGAQPQR